jgi:hypothetical protein
MKDTSLKIDMATRDRLKALAEARGLSMRVYVANLVGEAEHAELLDSATAIFRRVVSEPNITEAFDRDFGGQPQQNPSRTALPRKC